MLIENINVELEILAELDSLALFFLVRSSFFDSAFSRLTRSIPHLNAFGCFVTTIHYGAGLF